MFSPQPTRPLCASDLIICCCSLAHFALATQGLLEHEPSTLPPYFPETHLVSFLSSFVFADVPFSREAFPSTLYKNCSTLSPACPALPPSPTLLLSHGAHDHLAFFLSIWLFFWTPLESVYHESRNYSVYFPVLDANLLNEWISEEELISEV